MRTAESGGLGKGGLQHADLDRCYPGYTLFGTRLERDYYLIDMQGTLVHTWPTSVTHLGELLPNGNLLYGHDYQGVKEIDWQGEVQWTYSCDWHHDFGLIPAEPGLRSTASEAVSWWSVQGGSGRAGRVAILAGGRTRIFDRPDIFEGCAEGLSFLANHILEIEPETFRCTWRWWAHEHVDELRALGVEFPRPIDERSKQRNGDIFHCNTLEVLPDTKLGRRDQRFRAGNLLFSYRQMSTIGIIDRDSGDIVWAWGPGELDGQHEPTMIPDTHPLTDEPMPGAGHILVFDNGRYERDYSRVIEIDPVTNQIVWSSPTDWYSNHISGAQRLPNGNTLICDGPVGRLFEITPAGETVWEYVNPYYRGHDPDVPHARGASDTVRTVYRATRYPQAYVEQILCAWAT